jgi:hypothetical protein
VSALAADVEGEGRGNGCLGRPPESATAFQTRFEHGEDHLSVCPVRAPRYSPPVLFALGNFAVDPLPQKRDSTVGGVERSMGTCRHHPSLLGRVPLVREGGPVGLNSGGGPHSISNKASQETREQGG